MDMHDSPLTVSQRSTVLFPVFLDLVTIVAAAQLEKDFLQVHLCSPTVQKHAVWEWMMHVCLTMDCWLVQDVFPAFPYVSCRFFD